MTPRPDLTTPRPLGRRTFLASSAAAVAAILAGCASDDEADDEPGEPGNGDASVIVVGAGPAGMSAAHLLRQRGIAVRVLEAGPTYGGRIRHDRDFADAAIDDAEIWSGFKAFFEFDEVFYPAALAYGDSDTDDGQRLFYDAAYGQRTGEHVLGLFTVGAPAERYGAMSDDEFLADVLAELDATFDGAASRTYVKHRVRNWNDEPFARAAYLADDASSSITHRLAEPLGDRVFFAGDAYTSFDDWSSVHAAAWSAADAVDQLAG